MTTQPTEIRLSPEKDSLTVAFGETVYTFSAELLRVESPSAEVKGHGEGQKILVGGKKDVTIKAVEPIGNYAVQLAFSDGHFTGYYTWKYLAEMGEKKDKIWLSYLQNLEKKGLSRSA